jgi:glycerate kinase
MRVVIAPDKFAGTLTAQEAAEAIARGWQQQAPNDELDLAPMADGGPGFVTCLKHSLGGELRAVRVAGPALQPVEASYLISGDTAYLESAEAIGLHLADRTQAETASSFGLGQLILDAVRAGCSRIVVGVGGTATTDGGAGLLAALGATARAGDLRGGAAGLAAIAEVDLEPAKQAVGATELVLASDVDSQLSGLFGATKTFGEQKGITEDRIPAVDGWIQGWGEHLDRMIAAAKGAGAGGGVGFALMLLGAQRVPGVATVADSIGLFQRLKKADLVITGEGAFDFSSRSGKVPYGVAELAGEALIPCIAIAGQVVVGPREMRALGIEAAYSVSDLVGEEVSMAQPSSSLEQLATRVARTWSH